MYVLKTTQGRVIPFTASQMIENQDMIYRILHQEEGETEKEYTILIRYLTPKEIHDDAFLEKRAYLFDSTNQDPLEGNLGIPCIALCELERFTDLHEALEVIKGRESR